MKILHINTLDISGGAARAAYRLHKALLAEGIDSSMLVQIKISDDYTVIDIADNKMQKAFNRLRPIIDQIPVKFYKNRTKTLFSPAWFGFNNILKKIEDINPDIVHLHWICGGMIKIEDLCKIKKPIVWSLHDNWAFTGGCHIKWDCEKYKDKCGSCPRLGSNKENDLSRWVWNRKQKTFSKMDNLIINGLSRWIMNVSQQSSLLKDKRHINLPNPIDTNTFKPFDKEESRELWNLPKNKKLILFGAMSATSDINKGFKELSEALKMLNLKDIEFVVFGSSKPQNAPDFKFETHYVGHLYDDISLVTLYNAVDVMVVPSLQENLSNTIMESLSCGTPVVAFDVGGNSDMIEHKVNGYLAKPFDIEGLASGIEWILNNADYKSLRQNAREKVVKNFDSKIVAQKYINLYKEILNKP
ncbi:glycosyltransferase family 4 protein [Thermodesulfatator autotrophicus]|uniref:Glycosyl transferase family 1 n=1 Tax=Thermodesulfatator autotrophicus TaxID=1795632 RepID=A0A177E4Y6_9BACT|nr:glycosyltransferase family 4 protein [Thermodesulfatator autotrophicus]OAG27027.1 glycosyl transferase family 1 [Thermodesulfatator autotrophicus]